MIVSDSRYCGASELINDIENGILLKNPTNSIEIREKIELLLSDKELREKIGRNARKTAENFSWVNMTKKYEKVYFEILKGKTKLKK